MLKHCRAKVKRNQPAAMDGVAKDCPVVEINEHLGRMGLGASCHRHLWVA